MKLVAGILAIGIASIGLEARAGGGDPSPGAPISATLNLTGDFNKLVDQLGDAVERLLKIATNPTGTVPKFAQELTVLAGTQRAMADTLDAVAKNPQLGQTNSAGSSETLHRLNEQMEQIQLSFTRLRAMYRQLDHDWAFRNLPLNADIGGYAADGNIFYASSDGRHFPIADPSAARQLAYELRLEATRVQDLATRMGQTKLK